MLRIANIYGHGGSQSQMTRLEKLGLRIRPLVSSYPGSQMCRFIDFEKGPSIEMIEIEDEQEYLDFVPKGMKPYCPGISCSLSNASEKSIVDFERGFSHLKPYALHANYDGTTDEQKPGWNYLNFGIPIVRDTFIWLTEYEEPRPEIKHETAHPNGVQGLLGFVFDLKPRDVLEFERLAERNFQEGVIEVGGLHVWLRSAINNFPEVGEKTFPLIAVVLQTESLDSFAGVMKGVREISFLSRSAIQIETNKQSWDILMTA